MKQSVFTQPGSHSENLRLSISSPLITRKPTSQQASADFRLVPIATECSAENDGYSITSSARASSVGGMSMPSVLAVCRLMTNSNLGRSVSTASAASRQSGNPAACSAPAQRSKSLLRRNGSSSGRPDRRSLGSAARTLAINRRPCSVRPASTSLAAAIR